MKNLSKQDIKKLIDNNQYIEIYDDYINYNFTFYYIYAGDSQEAVFINDKFYGYFDMDDYVDKIKTRKDEKRILTKLIKEEFEDNYFNILEYVGFVDSNIIKDIRGELLWKN